jgi:hypothetical protein
VLTLILAPDTVICVDTHGDEELGQTENRHAEPIGVMVVLSGKLILNAPLPSITPET